MKLFWNTKTHNGFGTTDSGYAELTVKLTLRMALLLLLLLPTTAFAAGSIAIKDTVAGIGADATLTGFTSQNSVDLILRSPSAKQTRFGVSIKASGATSVFIPGTSLVEAGRYDASIVDRSTNQELVRSTFTVLPDTVDIRRSTITANKTFINPDGTDEAMVAVTLKDSFGNLLAGRRVQIISSRTREDVVAVDRETNVLGVQRFVLRTRNAGSFTLRAFDLLAAQTLDASIRIQAGDPMNGVGGYWVDDGQAPYSQPTYGYDSTYGSPYSAQLIPTAYAQEFGELDHFEVTTDPKVTETEEVISMTIRAVDSQNRTVEDYVGKVNVFSPTDEDATMPGLGGGVNFTPKSGGLKKLPLSVSFRRGGTQIIVVEDKADPSNPITGQASVTVEAKGPNIDPNKKIEVTFPTIGAVLNTRSIKVKGAGPRYSDIDVKIIGGTKDLFRGESDANGAFEIVAELKPDQTEFIMRVQSGQYDSGDISFTVDTDEPSVTNLTFSPPKPIEDTDVILAVRSEPKATATMKIGTQEFGMLESATQAGTFQVSFKAPAAGNQQVTVFVKDPAGNTTELRSILEVQKKGLAKVQELVGEPANNSIKLYWKALTDPAVTGYRIYIGKDPTNLYTIDSPTNGAQLSGLEAGIEYYVAVTALAQEASGVERESLEKSDPVLVIPLGLSLKATPQDGSVLLEWLFPETPIDTFLLEYGTDPDVYIEKRVYPGGLRTVVMRDLLNNVKYYFRLTPVMTGGQVLTDLATTTDATPTTNSTTFNPDPPDPIPFIPGNIIHEAPNTPGSGLLTTPTFWMTLGSVGLLAGLFQWHRLRKKRMTVAFLRAMEKRYRH